MSTRTCNNPAFEANVKTVRQLIGANKLNSPHNLGSYSQLYKTYQPQTADEFQCLIYHHGKRKLSEVLEQLIEVSERANTGLTREELKAAMIHFLVRDSFNGFHKEKVALTKLVSQLPGMYFHQDKINGVDFDGDYGVDILVANSSTQPDDVVWGIQVKPTSYFTSRPSVEHARNKVIDEEKNRKFEAEYGAGVFYLVYDRDTNDFVNWDECVATIQLAHVDHNVKAKLLNQKTGIDFLTEDNWNDAEYDAIIRLMEARKKQRKG